MLLAGRVATVVGRPFSHVGVAKAALQCQHLRGIGDQRGGLGEWRLGNQVCDELLIDGAVEENGIAGAHYQAVLRPVGDAHTG